MQAPDEGENLVTIIDKIWDNMTIGEMKTAEDAA